MLAHLVAAAVIPTDDSAPIVEGEEPISLELAKLHLRIVGDSSEDLLLAGQITAAREIVEGITGHILVRRTVVEAFSTFGPLALRAWPISPGTAPSVSYIDPNDEPQVYDGARIVSAARPAMVLPASGGRWPVARKGSGSVTVSFTAGYESAAHIPAQLKAAMLVAVANLYESRAYALTGDGALAVAGLCRRYRRWVL